MRTHLETGASLCGQIHGVYRYLYARGVAFHNQFPEATSTTTAWASRADRFRTLLSVSSPEVTFPLCAFKDSRGFSAIIASRRIYVQAAYIHLARISYSLFLLHFGTLAFRYYCLFTVNARINIKMTRDDTTMADDFITAFIKLRNNIFWYR